MTPPLTPLATPASVPIGCNQIREQGGSIMDGTVRSKGRCPQCKGPFELTLIGRDMDYMCPQCQTRPRRYYLDLYHEGQRIRLFSSRTGKVFRSYFPAHRNLEAIRLELENGDFDATMYVKRDQRPLQFRRYVQFYILSKEAEGLKPGTLKNKRYVARKHLIPHFGIRDIRQIKKRHCRELLNSLPNTSLRRTVRAELQALLNFAEDNEDIDSAIRVPRVSVTHRKPVWLTQEQQEAILEHIPGGDRPIYRFQVAYGCRTAEPCALQWDCVDFAKGIVTIRRNFSGRQLVDSPKEGDWKPLPMVPEIRRMLEELKRKRDSLVPWVFVNRYTGRSYRPEKIAKHWRTAAEKAGYPGVQLEYNRHSFIMQRLEAGCTYEEIAPITGHKDIQTMQKHYGRLRPEKLGRVVEMRKTKHEINTHSH